MTSIWCHCGLAALLMSSEEFVPHGHIDQFQNGRHNLRVVGSLQQKLHRKSRALPKTTCPAMSKACGDPVTAGSSGLSAIVKQMGQRTWRRHRDSDITHMWCASHDVKKSNTFKWWASDGQGQFQAQWQDLVVSCLQQKSAAWKMALQPPKHSPEVVKGQQIVWYQMFVRTWRNYTETMQGSLWVKDCFSQMRFGDARQTLDVHLSKSWIVVLQFRMESKWNKSGDEAKTSAAFFSALVFAAAAWKARSERAPELKHGLGMPSCLNVSKCPNVSILCILQ